MFNFGGGILAKAISAAKGAGAQPTFKFGRVVDVVLDESSPYWDEFGRSQTINGIRYRPLDKHIQKMKMQYYLLPIVVIQT